MTLHNTFSILLFFLWHGQVAIAQNTIGGKVRSIPEAEVERQSVFVNAETERMLGRYDNAIGMYKKFLYDNERNDAAWYSLARAEYAKDNLPGALEAIQKAVVLSPDNTWYQVLSGDIYEKGGRLKDAVTVYEALLKKAPQHYEWYEHLAYLQVLAGAPQNAVKTLDRLEKLTGLTETLAEKKHLLYVGLRDNKRAATELQRLADANPAVPEYRRHVAYFYEETGEAEAARKAWEQLLRISPGDAEAKLAVMGKSKINSDATFLQSLLPVFKDTKVSLEAKMKQITPYFAKIKADPSLEGPLLALGSALETTHPDDAGAWSLSGALLYQSGRPAEALERYRRCIRLNPTVFSVWENTLSILQSQQSYDEMLLLAGQAIDAFPNQARAYYYYGVAATEKDRPDDAVSQLDQALLMVGEDNGLRLDLLDQIGLALLRKKDYAGAVTRYQTAMQKGGAAHFGCLEHYGDALFHLGDAKKAQEYWQQALKIRETSALKRKVAEGKL